MRFQEITEGPDRIPQLIKLHAAGVAEAMKGDTLHVPATDEELQRYAETTIEEMANYDPTPGLKYLNWLVIRYKQRTYRFEDLSAIKGQLVLFDKLVKTKRIEKRDIMQYKTPSELYNALRPFLDGEEAISSTDEQRRTYSKPPHGRLVYKSPECIVVIPDTWESARFWGSNTNWCTVAGQSTYDHYANMGPLFNIHVYENSKPVKFQFHFPTQQLFNSADEPLSDAEWSMIPKAAFEKIIAGVEIEQLAKVIMGKVGSSLMHAVIQSIDWASIPLWSESEFCLRRFFSEHEFPHDASTLVYRPILDQLEVHDLLYKLRYSWRRSNLTDAINDELKGRDITGEDFDYEGPTPYLSNQFIDDETMRRLLKVRDIAKIQPKDQYKIITEKSTKDWVRDEILTVAAPEVVVSAAISMKSEYMQLVGERLPLPDPKQRRYIPNTDKQKVLSIWLLEPHYMWVDMFAFFAEAARHNVTPNHFGALSLIKYAGNGKPVMETLSNEGTPLRGMVVKYDKTVMFLLFDIHGDINVVENGRKIAASQLYNDEPQPDADPIRQKVLRYIGKQVEAHRNLMADNFTYSDGW